MAQVRPETDAGEAPALGARRWPCWIDVDLDAISYNVAAIRRWIGSDVRLLAVVKAQGYGLGAEVVATTALAAGADGVAVARVREGLRLRQHGVRAPILILTGFAPNEVEEIVAHELTPTLVGLGQLPPLIAAAERTNVRLPVHVKLDTGMRRYGSPSHEAVPLAQLIARSTALELEGFYTHFATADAADLSFARDQLVAFREACSALETDGSRPPYLHAANSAGTLALPDAHFNLVRVGLGIYGYYATPNVPRSVELRPSVTLSARVARLLTIDAGDTVGYGRTYRTTRPLRAALLTVGYADGLPGSHYRGGYVLLGGQRADIVGRISMDQCLVDVTHCEGVREGDHAVVLGQQGDDAIALDEYAELSGSIPHEALTSLGSRVPRVYWRGGAVVATATLAGEEWLHGSAAAPPD